MADIYKTRNGDKAYAHYTVYVDVGKAEDKFLALLESLDGAVESEWHDRYWK